VITIKILAALGIIAVIFVGTIYFFYRPYDVVPGATRALPDPKDILRERPPSEISWVTKKGMNMTAPPDFGLISSVTGVFAR
jgi:hypothetical protein